MKDREKYRRYDARNPEKRRAWSRAAYHRMKADPERYARFQERERAYRLAHPQTRAQRHRTIYKMEPEDYQRIFDRQEGCCAVCRAPLPTDEAERRQRHEPQVDHDHKTGYVRGLLCRKCNTRLGLLENVPVSWWRAAIDYLERSEERDAISRLEGVG